MYNSPKEFAWAFARKFYPFLVSYYPDDLAQTIEITVWEHAGIRNRNKFRRVVNRSLYRLARENGYRRGVDGKWKMPLSLEDRDLNKVS